MYKVIKDYPNYAVNEDGTVKNIKTERILQTYPDKGGYQQVYLYNKSGRKVKLVHRLVAESFIPNPFNYTQVNHKDENPANNRLDNLEWCSPEYNSNFGNHCLKISTRCRGEGNPFYGKKHSQSTKEKMRQAKTGQPSKRRKKVIANGMVFDSLTKCAEHFGISLTQVYNLINKKRFSKDLEIKYMEDK